MLESAYLIFLFLPGILLLVILSKRISLHIDLLETVLFGSVFWNYLLVSTSIITGISTQSTVFNFKVFDIVSAVIIVISTVYILRKHGLTLQQLPKIESSNILYGLTALLLFLSCFLVLYFHTIFVEWDAISYYIPSAKAILTSGGISVNPYRSLGFFDVSPAIPIVYSWLLDIADIQILYDLSLAYFLLTLVAIFLISRKLFTSTVAKISTLVFLSLPTVLIMVGARAFYLDVPFVLFLLVTLYSTIRILSPQETDPNSNLFNWSMLAIGITLLALTRIEFGFFLGPVALTGIILAIRPRNWEVIAVLTIGLGYYLREFRNTILNFASGILYLERLTPVFIISGILLIALKKLARSHDDRSRKMNQTLPKIFVLLLLVPFAVYIVRNVLVFQFVVPGLPVSNVEIANSIRAFTMLNPTTSAPLLNLFRWDYIVSVWWAVPPFLAPILISVTLWLNGIKTKKRIEISYLSVLAFFAGAFLLWSTLSCDPQPRRLYYFAPFIALAAGYGLSRIGKIYSSAAFAVRVCIYVIALSAYTLIRIGAKAINDFATFYGQLYQPKTDLVFVTISASIFILIFFPYEKLISRLHTCNNIQLSRRMIAAAMTATICLNAFLLSIPLSPFVSGITNRGYESRLEYGGAGWLYYPDVVDYYNGHVTDNKVTMGFFCNELITFSNRSVVDLSDPTYGAAFYSVLNTNDTLQVLGKIRQLNVGYFLKPNTENPFYAEYQRLVNSTIFGNVFLDNPQFRAIRTFKYATLYQFYQNFSSNTLPYSGIQPWNFNPTEDYSLTTELGRTVFSGTTNSAGELTIMYTLVPTLHSTDALWITLRTYEKAQLLVILYNNLQNRTDEFAYSLCPVENETRKLVVNINECTTTGVFDQNHIEGMLVGVRTTPNRTETFEISGLSSITYGT